MNKRKKLKNGWTVGFTEEWMRACRYATRILAKRGIPWHSHKHSTEYMSLRNGYLAGHRAGRRFAARQGEKPVA